MLLSLKAIRKSFGGVQALRDGDLEVRSGEVHLLMGENGAGKSTLMRILAGMYQRDSGEMLWRGKDIFFRAPAHASAEGIAMVHQESLLAPHLSVAENIYLGRETITRVGRVHRKAALQKASALIRENGFRLDPQSRVADLSLAGRQLVEICRAIAQGSSLLIFDEPTSSLSESETKEVFRIVRQLRNRGVAVIYITHRLEELREIGDRVTVLRDGVTVYTGELRNLTREQLIQHMVGRSVDAIYRRSPRTAGETLLKIENLSAGFLRHISFELRAGEIVGLAGLMGAGRTELCRLLFGIDRADHGTIRVAGKHVALRTPQEAVSAGIALIPEDHQRDGLALKLPIFLNVTLPDLGQHARLGLLNRRSELGLTRDYTNRLRIKCDSPHQPVGRTSGGNQQKVVIAKWIARGARIFLFDEPTRGIDIGAKQEVFEQIDRLARSGAAILMVSSELAELVQVADRILVMRQGQLTGELPGNATQESIMRLAAPASPAALPEPLS